MLSTRSESFNEMFRFSGKRTAVWPRNRLSSPDLSKTRRIYCTAFARKCNEKHLNIDQLPHRDIVVGEHKQGLTCHEEREHDETVEKAATRAEVVLKGFQLDRAAFVLFFVRVSDRECVLKD